MWICEYVNILICEYVNNKKKYLENNNIYYFQIYYTNYDYKNYLLR